MVLHAACFRVKHRQINQVFSRVLVQIKCSEINLCMFCKFNVHLGMQRVLGLLYLHTPNVIPNILLERSLNHFTTILPK